MLWFQVIRNFCLQGGGENLTNENGLRDTSVDKSFPFVSCGKLEDTGSDNDNVSTKKVNITWYQYMVLSLLNYELYKNTFIFCWIKGHWINIILYTFQVTLYNELTGIKEECAFENEDTSEFDVELVENEVWIKLEVLLCVC